MYNPKYSEQTDPSDLIQLINQYPFATLLSPAPDGSPMVSHVPILHQADGSANGKLVLHIARANPQWRGMRPDQEVLAIFHGPHTYVTPKWYPDPLNVPTWNYAVAHVYGKPKLIHDHATSRKILEELAAKFEDPSSDPWKLDSVPEDFSTDLIQGIVGIEIEITRMIGKFKLSQNRTTEDRQGVLDGLRSRKDEMSRAVLELMLQSET